MKRWIKAHVERTLTATVYLCVDDAVTVVASSTSGGVPRVAATPAMRKLAEEAAGDDYLLDHEWADGRVTAGPFVEVTQEAAENAGCVLDVSGRHNP